MTTARESTIARPTTLTTPQLAKVLRVWRAAGWLPVSGYEIVALAAIVAANGPLTETLTSVDFDDAGSVANAVTALLESRDRMWR
jgi:hypothetical protein